jgi:hypothetical protein
MWEGSAVNISELKRLAHELLPPSSGLKRLILSEPDLLSAQEAPVKAKIFARLLQLEIDGS